jgi:two-component system, OmpR family, alkaline phosphatase synthesis response regulator PhoP
MRMKKITILIVEDDRDLREAYVLILESEGFDVKSAENGLEALTLIEKEGDPAIIFLDLRMPVMDGIEFLEKYEASKHPDTEIVVFSNYDAKNEIDKAYELGAERYVLKVRAAPKELIRIVKTIMK